MNEKTLSAPLNPLDERESLADRAYREIRQAILDGQLDPGARLSVPGLATQLGVSRSPIREAVLRLEREGLAASNNNRGAVVATPNGQDLQDLYDVREVLEGLVARQAALRATEDDRTALQRMWEEHREAVEVGDLKRHMSTDLQFHKRLRQACRNPRAIVILDQLSNQIRLALFATASKPGNPELALREHRDVLDAVVAQDPDEAEHLARAHVSRIKKSLPAGGSRAGHGEVASE